MNIAERIFETVKNMPEAQAAEVLDFAEYVKAKQPAKPQRLPDEESRRLIDELQRFVEAQPKQKESAADYLRQMRDEARY